MARRKVRLSRRQAAAEKWRPLYEAAERIRELAPWQWMDEIDNFGVQDPETGKIGFVSVTGTLGEHFSISAYLGVNAVHQFWTLEEWAENDESWDTASELLLIPQIQVSFENRDMVEKEDANIMRRLKLKYRGRNAYPVFREVRPGCPFWLMDAEHIPFLTHVLEQTLDVAPRFREDERLLYPDDVDGQEMYLLRVPEKRNGVITWTDEIRPIPQPEERVIEMSVETAALEALRAAPRVGNSVEIDLFMTMTPVQEKRGERPFFPFALLVVDAGSGMILSQDLLSPLPSIDDMYSRVPQAVINMFLNNNMLPYEVNTQSPMLTAVLTVLLEQFGIPVVERPFLPMLNEAKEAMHQYTQSGFY